MSKQAMTALQRLEARHALGLPNKQRKSYRNRFCTGEDNEVWTDLVAQGLATMRRAASVPMGGSALFYLTEAGAKMALNDGERLCEEDFPTATA